MTSGSNHHQTSEHHTSEEHLSAWELGAAYALINDDLETCQALAQDALARDAYSSVCYTLLAKVARRKGDWVEVAEASRLALCFGAQDPQISSVLAGLYDLIDCTYERDWICEQFSVTAEHLFSAVPQESYPTLQRMLSVPPRLPKRRSVTRHGGPQLTHPKPTRHLGHYPPPPSWLDSVVSLDVIASEGLSSLPDWITSTQNWIDQSQLDFIPLPDWLERPPSLDEVFLGELPPSAPASMTVEPHVSSPIISTPHSSQARATLNSIEDIADLPTIYPTELADERSLTSAKATAYKLGLTGMLHVALELQSLSLIQDQRPTRELSGPLLLCQDSERLILIAYRDDQPRQNPWAFPPTHLTQIINRGDQLELSLQGGRQMIAHLDNIELNQALMYHLETWRQSHQSSSL